jgi:hypothetical protein
MPTYDYTGAAAGANPASDFFGKFVCYKKTLKVSDIIASDTTLTANGVIAAADVIQAIDVPAGFLFLGSAVKTVTPEGAALEADLGIGGGDEAQDGLSLNGTAGAATLTLVGDDWGPDNLTGYFFSAADTIDFTFSSETDAGEWIVYVWGVILD